MRRIDFVTLRLFVSIADERSLTRAAEREHLALAAVSKRISDLENQLGSALLYRQPKGVELTPAGHALLHHAHTLLDDLQSLGPLRLKEVDEAQQKMEQLTKDLADKGEIVLSKGNADDELVY